LLEEGLRLYIAGWFPTHRAGLLVIFRRKEGRMATESHGQDHDLRMSQSADRLTGVVPPEGQSPSGEDKSTYQVILRHLAKLRDGARAVLALFESGRADETDTGAAVPAPPDSPVSGRAPAVAIQPARSPMELRIERHMRLVDQALEQIKTLNPERKKRVELPEEARELIAQKERTIHDIVEAETSYWAAVIENNPLGRLDDMERAWVARIIRLANILGVDPEYREHLKFVENWASFEHH
jgi:hypothetical protein